MTPWPPRATTQYFAKGHGAENDFVILPDPDARLALSAAEVVRLCDRRAGIGADGVLRAVRCTAEPEARMMTDQAEWFMDYRNADGSKGTMCGNGIRVLARYLVDTGLCGPGRFNIATRAGTRRLHVPSRSPNPQGAVDVSMGRPEMFHSEGIEVIVAERRWPAIHVDVGNPHAVVFVDDLALVGELRTAPTVEPPDAYPFGATIEFVTSRGPRHLALRVYERGVGETRSCGTGACAAVAAILKNDPQSTTVHYTVDAPGGRLRVSVLANGSMELTGPAAIIARGTVNLALTTVPRSDVTPCPSTTRR